MKPKGCCNSLVSTVLLLIGVEKKLWLISHFHDCLDSFQALAQHPVACSMVKRTPSDWKLGEGLGTRLDSVTMSTCCSTHSSHASKPHTTYANLLPYTRSILNTKLGNI